MPSTSSPYCHQISSQSLPARSSVSIPGHPTPQGDLKNARTAPSTIYTASPEDRSVGYALINKISSFSKQTVRYILSLASFTDEETEVQQGRVAGPHVRQEHSWTWSSSHESRFVPAGPGAQCTHAPPHGILTKPHEAGPMSTSNSRMWKQRREKLHNAPKMTQLLRS